MKLEIHTNFYYICLSGKVWPNRKLEAILRSIDSRVREVDEETGLYYFGARYYDPRISLWYGVDPLAAKYPNASPYIYCLNNPILFVDDDGKEIIIRVTGRGDLGDKQRQIILAKLQLLTNDKLAVGTDGKVRTVGKINANENVKPEGTSLINNLVNGAKTRRWYC
ncbi:MAG: RHS repeat-associated core domain-containing protein [Bacteroidetes bacterium]|nr:RHS repeat-associated core domain-containing protein [Bacteroidota bacterium]